ncbi:hypothetical protein JQ615_09090 [Bradyrhizobium jicamae]|uniref:Ribbon-helix-helix protein CopG domain-containing protein n=1 Tax=Bradyrhizobium jicamae TaxID=280332 RepID=A0ABS5FFI1_9BRAD|nr:hypothetical protein [Bradyrhizobium jicamae]MBR0795542.1 hypothetical protein [Bradyrhizobium jicamae]MBR0932581.1 hypothetical protein [Bradyrhizobium jicamae]
MPRRGRPKGPDKEPVLLRLGSPLLDVLDRLAAAELRSRQGQIEKLLHEALIRRGAWPPKAVEENEADDTHDAG